MVEQSPLTFAHPSADRHSARCGSCHKALVPLRPDGVVIASFWRGGSRGFLEMSPRARDAVRQNRSPYRREPGQTATREMTWVAERLPLKLRCPFCMSVQTLAADRLWPRKPAATGGTDAR
jgi:hypothetical protein